MRLFQIKKIMHSKGNHNKMKKRQHMEWEKIFANHISGKRLISNIHKEPHISKAKNGQFKDGQRT